MTKTIHNLTKDSEIMDLEQLKKDYYDKVHMYHSDAKELHELALECLSILDADVARISHPGDKMFLVIGYHKNSQNWIQVHEDGSREERNFKYFEEHVVASGNNRDSLLESTKKYAKLCEMDIMDYLFEKKIKNT